MQLIKQKGIIIIISTKITVISEIENHITPKIAQPIEGKLFKTINMLLYIITVKI